MDPTSKKVLLKSEEIIMVLLQYLKEHGYIKSMISLESETNVKLAQYGKEITFFRQLIIEGQWEDAENFLKPLKVRQHFNFNRALYELKRQQFLEDIECCHSDELDIAGLLSRAKELQDKCSKEEFNNLCSYLTLPNLRDHPDFKNWSVEKGRIACFEAILELLKTIYPVESYGNKIPEGRLVNIIKQAVQYQCLIGKNEPEIQVGLLNEFIGEDKEKKLFVDLFGEGEFADILVDEKNGKYKENTEDETDILAQSSAAVYFGQPKGYQVDPRNRRPITAHSMTFKESKPSQISDLIPKKTSPAKIQKEPHEISRPATVSSAQKPTKIETESAEISQGSAEKSEPELYNEQESNPDERLEVEENTPDEKEDQNYIDEIENNNEENEEDKKPQTIDITKMSQRAAIIDKQPIRTCCFSPEGELLAVGTNSMTLKICSLKDVVYSLNDKYQCSLEGSLDLPVVLEQRKFHNGSIYSVDWSHTGRLIATGSNDKTINLLVSPFSDPSNTNKSEILQMALTGHKSTVRSVCFEHNNEQHLASGGLGEGTVRIWDTENGTVLSKLEGHKDSIYAIKAFSGGNKFVSVGMDKTIKVWDIRQNVPINSISATEFSPINDISICPEYPNGEITGVCHSDGMITIWDLTTNKLVMKLKQHSDESRAISFSSDGIYRATCSFDKTIKISKILSENEEKVLNHEDKVVCVKWHPFLPILVSTAADSTARVWTV